MPITRAAAKAIRQTAKHRARNQKVSRDVKRAVRVARATMAKGSKEPAVNAVRAAVKILDRAAQKKVIKRNTAARLKSRLAAQLKKLH